MRATRSILMPLLSVVTLGACGGREPERGSYEARLEPFSQTEEGLRVCAGPNTVKGIDVSYYQHTIDWAQVAGAGYAFAITRINDGTFHDPQFAPNWNGIHAAGMIRGAYQFWEPTDDPTWQANLVVSAVGHLGPGDLPVTLDVEWTVGTPNAAGIETWVNIVRQGTGKTPMIYTAVGYWNQYFNGQFGDLPLWVANYGVTCPSVPNSWSNWVFWQWGGQGVPGISGNVDHNLFNGTLAQLHEFAGGAASCSNPNAIGHAVGGGGDLSGGACGGRLATPTAPTACGTLQPGQGLGRGSSVRSCDARFQLVMQGDANLVMYSHGNALWNTGSNARGGDVLVMQEDGNLVLYSDAGCALWNSGTAGHPGAWLSLQDDGNMVVYGPGGHALWSSGTGPVGARPAACGAVASGEGLARGESVAACGGCFNLVLQGDGNLVLYRKNHGALWSSQTAGQPGCAMTVEPDGNLNLYSDAGCPLWSTSSNGHPGARLAVQDDGNLVMYGAGNAVLWASNTVACQGGCDCNPPAASSSADSPSSSPAVSSSGAQASRASSSDAGITSSSSSSSGGGVSSSQPTSAAPPAQSPGSGEAPQTPPDETLHEGGCSASPSGSAGLTALWGAAGVLRRRRGVRCRAGARPTENRTRA